MNAVDVLLALLIAAAALWALRRCLKKPGCGCGCPGCKAKKDVSPLAFPRRCAYNLGRFWKGRCSHGK